MDKTPGQVAYGVFYEAYLIEDPRLWDALPDFDKNLWEKAAAAVIAHITPQIRAAAIEDAAKAVELDGIDYAGFHAKMIRALASLPSSHVCVPLRPSRERIKAGAERLLRWQDDTKPEDFSGLQWASAMQDAERVYLSMTNYDAAAMQPRCSREGAEMNKKQLRKRANELAREAETKWRKDFLKAALGKKPILEWPEELPYFVDAMLTFAAEVEAK